MRSKFHLIDEMRSHLRSALPEKAFLRRDRGEGLFVSNGPVFGMEDAVIPGFHVERIGQLIRLYPDIRWLRKLEEDFRDAENDLCGSLLRFKGMEPSKEAMALFRAGLKLLDAGDGAAENEIAAFDREIRQLAARALRKDIGGGGLYGLSLLDGMLKK